MVAAIKAIQQCQKLHEIIMFQKPLFNIVSAVGSLMALNLGLDRTLPVRKNKNLASTSSTVPRLATAKQDVTFLPLFTMYT